MLEAEEQSRRPTADTRSVLRNPTFLGMYDKICLRRITLPM